MATSLGLLFKKQTQLQRMSNERRMQTLRKCFCKVCLLFYILSCKKLVLLFVYLYCFFSSFSTSNPKNHIQNVAAETRFDKSIYSYSDNIKFALKLTWQCFHSSMKRMTYCQSLSDEATLAETLKFTDLFLYKIELLHFQT